MTSTSLTSEDHKFKSKSNTTLTRRWNCKGTMVWTLWMVWTVWIAWITWAAWMVLTQWTRWTGWTAVVVVGCKEEWRVRWIRINNRTNRIRCLKDSFHNNNNNNNNHLEECKCKVRWECDNNNRIYSVCSNHLRCFVDYPWNDIQINYELYWLNFFTINFQD